MSIRIMPLSIPFFAAAFAALTSSSLFAQQSLLDEVQKTIESSQRRAHELRQAGRPIKDLRRANHAFKEKLTKFLENSPPSGEAQYEDSLAMAICSDVLQKRELCLEYCRQAVGRNSVDSRITPIHIRTLLNLGLVDSAHQQLKLALQRQPADSSTQGLRYLVFLEAKKNSRWEIAAENVSALMQRHCDQVVARETAGIIHACGILDPYVHAMGRVGRTDDAKTLLAQMRSAASQTESDKQFPISLLNYFECEITRVTAPDDFETAVMSWIDNIWDDREPNGKEVLAVLDYIMLQNSHMDVCSQCHSKIQLLQEKVNQAVTRPFPKHVLVAANKVERMLSIRAEQVRLIGTTMPLDVQWISDQPKTPKGYTLIAFQLPYDDFPTDYSRLAVELRHRFKGLSLISIFPFTGFFWDQDTVSRREKIDEKRELAMMRDYASDRGIQGHIAMVPKESRLSESLDIQIFPTFVLLDSDRTIRMISYGNSRKFMSCVDAMCFPESSN